MGHLDNLIITAVIETVAAGTLQADAGDGTDALRFTQDTKPPKTEIEWIDNPEYTGTLGASEGYTGPRKGGFDIGMLLRGSGYYDVAPPMGILLKACGFKEVLGTGGTVDASPPPTTTAFTVTGSDLEVNDIILVDVASGATASFERTQVTDVTDGTGNQEITVSPALSAAPTSDHAVLGQPTYKLSSDPSDHKSLSIYHYLDGIKISSPGCRGVVKFDLKWKELAKAMFTFTPLDWTESDADYGSIPDFSALQSGMPVMAGVFTHGGTDTYIESLSLDTGQNVPALGAIQSSGYYQNFMGDRNVVGTFDPFASSSAVLTAFKAGAKAAIWFSLGSGDNQVVISMRRTKYKDVSFADREKINTYAIGFQALETLGDDELAIAFCSETASS